MNKHSKFTMAELVIASLFLLGIDVIAAFFDSFAVGWLIATPLQAAASFGTSWWIRSKGDKHAWSLGRQLKKQGANFLPWVPTAFTAFVIEAVRHNNPKVAGIAKK